MMIWTISVVVFGMFFRYAADIRNVTKGANWFEANSQCGSNGIEYNLTILSGLEQLQNLSFWLGVFRYEIMTLWMYPKGCYYIQRNKMLSLRTPTVGRCQHSCNPASSFAFQGMQCQCLDNVDLSNISKANLSDCNSNKDDVMMVYSVFYYPAHDKAEETCMISRCQDQSPHRVPQNCKINNFSITVICDDRYSANGNQLIWNADYEKAKHICSLKHKSLLSPTDCPANHTGVYTWTSAFREQIILEDVSEGPMAKQNVCFSGTRDVKQSKGVNVTRRNCSDMLFLFVCRQGVSNQSTIDIHDETKTHGILIGGIVVGFAAVSVVSALLLWIWWKRKNDDSKQKQTNINVSTNDIETRKVSNMQYSLAMSNLIKKDDNKHQGGTYKHDYSTVQKHNKEDTVDSVYVSAKEEEYDELNNISSRKIHQGPSNTYGFLGQSDEGEYDTMKGVSNGFGNSTEDMYDSNVPNCKGSSDNTYDTANINHFRTK